VREEGWRVVPMPAPPFYTLGKLFVTYCNVQYRLVVTNGRLRRDLVRAHTAPCAAERVPGPAEARRFLIDHLVRAGYDTRTLE
jgi:hypothetical protein